MSTRMDRFAALRAEIAKSEELERTQEEEFSQASFAETETETETETKIVEGVFIEFENSFGVMTSNETIEFNEKLILNVATGDSVQLQYKNKNGTPGFVSLMSLEPSESA